MKPTPVLLILIASVTVILVARHHASSSASRHPNSGGRVGPPGTAFEGGTPNLLASEPEAVDLRPTLSLVVDGMRSQESGKDATCWTTVRMMDAHFAGRPIPDEVALIKIEACKTLVYRIWRQASATAPADVLHAQDIDAALPDDMQGTVALMVAAKPAFGTDLVRSVMNRDYHRITENQRYLQSIAVDAIGGVGLFAARPVDLKQLTPGAVGHLAAAATVVTTSLLDACARSAASRSHPSIRADDVRDSFAITLATLGPSAQEPASSTRAIGAGSPPDLQSGNALLEDTRRTIAGKITALRAWNSKVWVGATEPEQRQMELINRMTKVPFTRDAFRSLQRRLGKYADYAARGIAPMQHNTFWTPVNGQAIFEPVRAEDRPRVIELSWAAEAMENLFPRSIAENGDVLVELMGNPAVAARAQQEQVRMLDWELDAVRDTTLHWTVLEQAWSSGEARPADPFALELLADRMSELALLFIRSADAAAIRQHRPTITSVICDNMLMEVQFAVHDRGIEPWPDEAREEKTRVMSSLDGVRYSDLFSEQGIAAGLPDAGAVARRALDAPSTTKLQLIELMGSGVAVGDIDRDGLPDLFLAGDGGNRLMRNLGGRRFEDVGLALGVVDDSCADAHHALFVDFDNDGRLDLFVVHSASRSRIFHQEPSGDFTDVSATCGIVTGPGAHDAVFFDYDGDGLLDCYVGVYGLGMPALSGRNAPPNRLFHNLGGGHFADVTAASGTGSTGWTLATAAIDVDHDGRMDLFVANDYGRSELFINHGDGTFVERGRVFGVDDRGSSMNASVIDIDGDGWMDVYISQIDMFSKSLGWVFPQADSQLTIDERILKSTFSIAGNKLFRNNAGQRFAAIEGAMFEPGNRGWSWCACFTDVDDDGDDDLYLTNGWVDGTPAGGQSNQLFIREGQRFFLSPEGVESWVGNSRGAAATDLTASGRMDLVVNDYNGRPRLLANHGVEGNHWLKVKLAGTRSNRQGIGAVVRLTRSDGTRCCRQVNCGANYLSQDETTLTFGLGKAAQAADLVVVWPGGVEQRVSGPFSAGSLVEIVEAAPRPGR